MSIFGPLFHRTGEEKPVADQILGGVTPPRGGWRTLVGPAIGDTVGVREQNGSRWSEGKVTAAGTSNNVATFTIPTINGGKPIKVNERSYYIVEPSKPPSGASTGTILPAPQPISTQPQQLSPLPFPSHPGQTGLRPPESRGQAVINFSQMPDDEMPTAQSSTSGDEASSSGSESPAPLGGRRRKSRDETVPEVQRNVVRITDGNCEPLLARQRATFDEQMASQRAHAVQSEREAEGRLLAGQDSSNRRKAAIIQRLESAVAAAEATNAELEKHVRETRVAILGTLAEARRFL